MYFFLNQDWSDALNNRYVCTGDQIVVCLLAKIKKTDLLKIQVTSHTYFEYEKKSYLKANKTSV